MASIHPITTKTTQNVPGILLGKPTKIRTRRPRRRAVRTAEQQAETMQALYRWRDERRAYAAQLAAAKSEERWGGARSLLILTLLSSVMVGLLAVGALAG
jgi:hypothetical protein